MSRRLGKAQGAVSADGRVALMTIQYPVLEELDHSDLVELKDAVRDVSDGSTLQVEMGGDLFFNFEETGTDSAELIGLLAWDGFSGLARATKQSPLLRMEHGALLAPDVTIAERSAEGIAAPFQEDGFIKPPVLTLIDAGRAGAVLVSPRTAREYGLETNGADASESPESLELAAGSLPAADALAALDTGLYISNLWYLNYSDRAACRITGMTRFATFWVENGRIAAPVGAMRFDDTLYRMLGENLEALSIERELLLDPSTYEGRSTTSARLPGALLRALRFTL